MNNTDEPIPVAECLDLGGAVALVTGASGNIGRAIALRLAEAGAEIIVHYHADAAAAAATADAIRHTGRQARTARAELGSAEGVEALFDSPVDLVVNNAATQPVVPLADMSAAEWRAVMATNVDGAFNVTRAAASRWRERGTQGAVVNVASIEGVDPAFGHAHYAASKAALLMLTRSVALEYGGDGIRCNAVSPGLIHREGLERDWPEGVSRWRAHAPLGGPGAAADVADAVLFLLSPAARWISGANLVVDGGMSAVPRW